MTPTKTVQVLALERKLFWDGVGESIRSTLLGKDRLESSGLTFILDMNGVILHRENSKERLGSTPRPCNFRTVVGKKKRRVWLRPHLDLLLSFSFQRHNIGFWTSARTENALPVLNRILKRPKQTPRFVLTRADTTPDRSSNTTSWATIKDLNVVSPTGLLTTKAS